MPKNTVEVGKRLERAIVKALEALGYAARRQPGSGNRDVDLQHDVVWKDSPIGKLHIECKFKSKSTWKTCENDRGGADILVMREARDVAKVFMDWDTFLALVGSAADRSEHLHELPPDKPWLTEPRVFESQGREPFPGQVSGWDCAEGCQEDDKRVYIWGGSNYPCPIHGDGSEAKMLGAEQQRRARIQAAHQNPPQRKPKPRGFGK